MAPSAYIVFDISGRGVWAGVPRNRSNFYRVPILKMGEVRRPDLVKEYVQPPPINPEDLPPDYMALLSLLFGLAGLLMKV